jgi:DNA-3-methyladenine glycosylase
MRVRDRVAVVTGGAAGVGRAAALATDIARAGDVQAIVDGVLARFGRIDVLVNNAGIGRPGRIEGPDRGGVGPDAGSGPLENRRSVTPRARKLARARGMRPLPRRFYLRPAPVVARDLLGCVLVSRLGGAVTAGRIVETEAYLGPEDAASHAAFRPSSHALFYGPGGRAYVFLAYGLHACLNVITGVAGTPGCVLIRALEPVRGRAAMARRRDVPPDSPALASGPARLTQALAVTLAQNGADLTRGRLTIVSADMPGHVAVATGPRIGITRATEPALRFWIAGHRSVSRPERAKRP